MKYTVHAFSGGLFLRAFTVEEKHPIQAARKFLGAPEGYQHVRVVGQKVWRYARDKRGNARLVKDDAKLFKVSYGSAPAILAMYGTIAEISKFKIGSQRDKVYEELCTEFPSAESVEADPAQTDITASSGATSDSGSGSTAPKTLSGSATSVTWLERLTLLSTDDYSGKGKSAALVETEWSPSSETARSKSKTSTLWATVKTLPEIGTLEYPGVSPDMKEMENTTILVTKQARSHGEMMYRGEDGWLWRQSWLDFDVVYAEVLDIDDYANRDGLYFDEEDMSQYKGSVIILEAGRDQSHFHAHGCCWAKEWLKPASKPAPQTTKVGTVKRVKIGRKSNGLIFVAAMKLYIGKKLEFTKKDAKYTYDGWLFDPSWIDFGGKKNVKKQRKIAAIDKITITAKVIDNLPLGSNSAKGVYCPEFFEQYQGKVMRFRESFLRGIWRADGWSFDEEWLESPGAYLTGASAV